jgi:hypothetical protein
MAPIAEGIAAGATAAAEQHRAGLLQAQRMRHAPRAQMGAVAEPAVTAQAAAAQVVHPRRKIQAHRSGHRTFACDGPVTLTGRFRHALACHS